MIRFLLISILFLLNLHVFASQITKEGYRGFFIGKTLLATVYEKYPEKTPLIIDIDDSTQMISFDFIDEGIELLFMSKQNNIPSNIVLYQIDITAPCLALTQTDINIGIGSKETLLKKYAINVTGSTETNKEHLYIYDTFWFTTRKGKVERISITSN